MNQIQDYDAYNDKMALSMVDKTFFVDKIDPDLIVDFGSANGLLLRHVKSMLPHVEALGYDNNLEMAKYSTSEIPIVTEWALVLEKVSAAKQPAIVCSSLIHEVFHYCSKSEIENFWQKLFGSRFRYIVIRDMAANRSVDRPSNINDVKKVYNRFLGTKVLTDFERVWGSIENNRQLLHFLLKYQYEVPNWEREVRENYLPISREDLLAKIPLGYDVVFHEHYVLPYLWRTVKNDTGIDIKDSTHLKLILQITDKDGT